MYTKMNSLTIVGLFAAGVLGASSGMATTSAAAVTAISSSSAVSTVSAVSAAAFTAAQSQSAAIANGTWAYFNTTVTSVVVVQELTTTCSEATTLTFNECEYPATKGEVVVVTNCPCTVTKTHPTLTSSICPPGVTWSAHPPPPETEVAPVPSGTPTVTPHVPVVRSSTPHSYPTNPPVQVGGVAPAAAGSGNAIGLLVAAVAAAAFGF
ncbi:hypothetical protein F5B17DRAFT_217463 [Nemania serpens]|nr:hypothetical protein F5B17DRAFT_217463 [Nemania serpens]